MHAWNKVEMNNQQRIVKELSLAEYTTWKVGGVADCAFFPESIDELAGFLQNNSERVTVLGGGSNVLISDKGVRGVVIFLSEINGINQVDEKCFEVESGVVSSRFAKQCQERKVSGAEFLFGIPGTIGGAVAMNAGAFGGEIWTLISSVKTVDMNGNIKIRDREEFDIGYRKVTGLNGEIIVSAVLDLSNKPDSESVQNISELLEKRKNTQPIGKATCGSVFKNPEGDYAARLIEEAGLKGKKIGGAIVSNKHANFIENEGGAKAKDIESLIELIKKEVKEKFQIELEEEVKYLGE